MYSWKKESREMSERREKEIDEAVNAANEALYYLGIAEEKLDAARGWGIADIIGGRMFTTMMKRSKMTEATNAMRAAKDALDRLDRELKDVGGYQDLDTDLDSYLGISDYLFDNVLIDMMTQSRISSAYNSVKNAISEVEGILDALSDISYEEERNG